MLDGWSTLEARKAFRVGFIKPLEGDGKSLRPRVQSGWGMGLGLGYGWSFSISLVLLWPRIEKWQMYGW